MQKRKPTPKICTLALIVDDEHSRILLAMKKRGFGQGRWNGAGGKVEKGETLEAALVRETQEEIGVTPLNWEKVAVHDFIMDADAAEPWHMIVHAYICRRWQGEPVESEEMKPQWFNISDIPFDAMWQDDVVWLPLVLKGKKLKTTFRFDEQDNMVGANLDIFEGLID